MNEISITAVGHLANDPEMKVVGDKGHSLTRFRMASTTRRYDAKADVWVDGDTSWFNVTCWRGLAERVVDSLHKGDGVIVHGRLAIREYADSAGGKHRSADIEATAVGPDLNRGTATLVKTPREPRAEAWSESPVDPYGEVPAQAQPAEASPALAPAPF